jgi:hypothetical protein
MKRSIQWTADVLFLAAILALSWVLLSPQTARRSPVTPVPPESPAEPVVQPAAADAAQRATTRQIAGLFGWRAPVDTAPPGRQPDPPARPDWLRLLGYVVASDGLSTYAFKDTRNGTVFSLRPGQESKGWHLVEVRGKEFVLEFAGQMYIIEQGN